MTKTSWRSASLLAGTVPALTTACGREDAGSANSRNVGATALPGGHGGGGAGEDPGGAVGGERAAPGPAGAPAGRLPVAVEAELGKVMAGGVGLTLYRFDRDTTQPPASNREATVPGRGRRCRRTAPRPAVASTRRCPAGSPAPTGRGG